MATTQARLEAFREVLIAQKFRQSRYVEAFDTDAPAGLNRQFYLTGPVLESVELTNSTADAVWSVNAALSFVPSPGRSDADRGRIEIVAALDALVGAWAADITLHSDVFTVTSASPLWDDEHEFWAVDLTAEMRHKRTL